MLFRKASPLFFIKKVKITKICVILFYFSAKMCNKKQPQSNYKQLFVSI